ncbi:MAG: hypothetical protein H7Y09_07515 [Chitinophagaceae bacterium]|nr:hypothetical protein [Anaerolineae bacterium]
MEKTETKLAFLTRVGDEFGGTLHAASAISRVEMLINDVERANKSFAGTPPEDVYGGWRPFPLDIISYYSVAYVTCLEWHVRSRLTDFFTYAPASITAKDLKKDASDKVMATLIGANASIPQFLAATPNYSNADAYLDTFGRIFKYLNIKPDPRLIAHNIAVPKVLNPASSLECLTGLYDGRNMLVHEINDGNIGHPLAHDPWTCEIAIAYGQFVHDIMRGIEAVITEKAPTKFPNKLLPDGGVIDIDDRLDEEIRELEGELTERIEAFGSALKVSRAAMIAEQEMLFQAHELHMRWIDLKAPARRALRRGRLQYLQALQAAFD